MVLFGISISMIVFWLVIALIMLIVETLTAGLTTIWFAGGREFDTCAAQNEVL